MTLTLTTTCQIPGCTQPIAEAGVCDSCRVAFGDMLRGDTPLPEDVVARRDREVRVAYQLQAVEP